MRSPLNFVSPGRARNNSNKSYAKMQSKMAPPIYLTPTEVRHASLPAHKPYPTLGCCAIPPLSLRVACRAELPQMVDAFKSHSDYYGFPHDEHSSVLLGYNGPAMGAAFGFNRNPKNIANL